MQHINNTVINKGSSHFCGLYSGVPRNVVSYWMIFWLPFVIPRFTGRIVTTVSFLSGPFLIYHCIFGVFQNDYSDIKHWTVHNEIITFRRFVLI